MPEHKAALFGEKRCTKCEVPKHFFCFPQNVKMVDGLDSWCRDCTNEASKENYRRKSRKKGLHNAIGSSQRGRSRSLLKGPSFEDWEDVT